MQRSSSLRSLLVSALLVLLGAVLGYRFGQTHTLPRFLSFLSVPTSSSAQSGGLLGKVFNTTPPAVTQDVDFQTFWQVWQMLEKDYLNTEKLNHGKMVDGAIAGMTASLGDPYTVYLPPEDNKRSGEDLAGAFYGVGIELGYVDNTLAVIAPVKGTPAERAGLKAGDLILHVKDESRKFDSDTAGWSLNEAVEHIRGEKGSLVVLTLFRKDDTDAKPFEVTLERGEIIVPSVELAFAEHNGKKVAHLKLSRFGERTSIEWDKAVTDILAQQKTIAGVVLDVRNNPGGFFDGAIKISSEFITDGTVVMQKGKYTTEEFKARGSSRLAAFPVEVLVNRGSASASEIVAGALRDRKDAKLIGEKTFGKGTVQDRRALSNGGGVHITIAQWLLPKGDWIHEHGIPVNIEVTDNPETPEDEVLNRAIDEI